jgi:hypothetical protein
MNIFKLKYESEQQAIIDLKSKGVLVETEETDGNIQLSYGEGIQAVVNIGKIVEVEGTYDSDFNVITEPIYYDGYFYDVMSEQKIDFGTNEIFPVNCIHAFAGYNTNAEGEVTEVLLADE